MRKTREKFSRNFIIISSLTLEDFILYKSAKEERGWTVGGEK
jgi:hypothetical protein